MSTTAPMGTRMRQLLYQGVSRTFGSRRTRRDSNWGRGRGLLLPPVPGLLLLLEPGFREGGVDLGCLGSDGLLTVSSNDYQGIME